MARGDAFSDSFISIPPGVTVLIQPAEGVEVAILSIFTYSPENAEILSIDKDGNKVYCHIALRGGETSANWVRHAPYLTASRVVFLINNSEFIGIRNISTTLDVTASYYGVQTK
ncbi:MAG: hypothetical protein QXT64_00790 [Desulfurococcaceae archaeon]